MTGLLLGALWIPVPGRAQSVSGDVPQSEEDAVLEASRRLSRVDARLRLPIDEPTRRSLRLERLRLLYFLSVAEEGYLDLAELEIEALRESRAPAAALLAFEGALEVVRGKHAFWPHDKIGHVRDGLAVLDRAVVAAPQSRDARYLRLLSCFYLPFFFGRGDTVEEDLAALARLLTRGPGTLSPASYAAVGDFVLRHARLSPPVREALAMALGGSSSSGAPDPAAPGLP